MKHSEDLAIVLRAVTYEDRHQIITGLTESHGKISAMARNSIQSRRFGSALEPFTAAEWSLVQKKDSDFFGLNEAHVRHSYDGLRKDILRMSIAGVFSEILEKMIPPGEPCPELFRLHSNALLLAEKTPSIEEVDLKLLNAYLIKILQWYGNQPLLLECVSCEKKLISLPITEGITLDVERGSWLCHECNSNQPDALTNKKHLVQAGTLFDLFLFLNKPIKEAVNGAQSSREEHLLLFRFLEKFLTFHVPGFDRKSIKSLKLIDLKSKKQRPL